MSKNLTEKEIDKWLENVDLDTVDNGMVNGYNISVNEECGFHSVDVCRTVTFLDYDVSIRFEGTKEVSYDRWVDTNWCDWEYC